MVVQLLVHSHLARYYCHLGGRTSEVWALRYSITRRTLLLPSREKNMNSLGAAVQHNFRRTLLLPSSEENINSLGAAVQHNFRHTLLVPSREQNISSLGATVQHNFRRTLLLPSREENIKSLGAAVQHNFRDTLLLPSREENIKRISIAWATRYSQAKIPEGAKSFTLKSTRQGSNDGELLYPKYTRCKAKRPRVQWNPHRDRVQLHPLYPSGYGPARKLASQ